MSQPTPSELNRYIGNADLFPILNSWDFFNHSGVSPLPRPAAQALIDFAHQSQAHSYLNAKWRPDLEKVRELAAQLIHAEKSEIAFIKNTSEGLSIVANAIDWKPGDAIVTTNVEYPANMYPWMAVAERFNVKLVSVQEETDSAGKRCVPLEKVLAAAGQPGVRLVTISHVEFASGQRHDLAAIGRFCREHGITFLVDAIQSLGAVPIDVTQMPIDYLACGGQKWLLSPEGTGIFYCRKELLPKTRPLTIGCLNVVNPNEYKNYDFTLRPDAGRFESGGQNVPGFLAMKESLAILLDAGTEAVSLRIKSLGDRLAAGAAAKGHFVASPRDGEHWSGIVSIALAKGSADELALTLRKEHRIEAMVRHGRLRVAPHFYNTEAQIDRLVGLLPG